MNELLGLYGYGTDSTKKIAIYRNKQPIAEPKEFEGEENSASNKIYRTHNKQIQVIERPPPQALASGSGSPNLLSNNQPRTSPGPAATKENYLGE